MRAAFIFFLTLFAFLRGGVPTAQGVVTVPHALGVKNGFRNTPALLHSGASIRAGALPGPEAPSFFNIELADDDESSDPQLEPLLRSLGGLLSAFLPEPHYDSVAAPAHTSHAYSFLSTDRYIGLCTFRI